MTKLESPGDEKLCSRGGTVRVEQGSGKRGSKQRSGDVPGGISEKLAPQNLLRVVSDEGFNQ